MKKTTKPVTGLVPLKSENENLVWKAIWDLSGWGEKKTGHYVEWEDIYAKVESKVTKRQFSGYISSLSKKGYIFCFTELVGITDVEVSCDAARLMAGKKIKGHCNSIRCSCNSDMRRKI